MADAVRGNARLILEFDFTAIKESAFERSEMHLGLMFGLAQPRDGQSALQTLCEVLAAPQGG